VPALAPFLWVTLSSCELRLSFSSQLFPSFADAVSRLRRRGSRCSLSRLLLSFRRSRSVRSIDVASLLFAGSCRRTATCSCWGPRTWISSFRRFKHSELPAQAHLRLPSMIDSCVERWLYPDLSVG
jgi:hypothetical protein